MMLARIKHRVSHTSKALVASLFLMLVLPSNAQSNVEEVAHQLSQHHFKKVHRMFSKDLKKQVACKQLKRIWEQTEATFGAFQSYSDPSVTTIQGQEVEWTYLHFTQNSFRLKVTEKEGKITGILIQPLSYQIPSYGKNLPVSRKPYVLKTDTFEMDGELVLPLGCDNCPLVILVHGSGPNDMDETVGPNKVFNDLAMGLAKHGVASFRYDKRTKVYPAILQGQFDIYDETVDDAVSAIQLMEQDTQFHFSAVILLGHSLGGYAMPLIVEQSPSIDGAILFSGNARPIQDLMIYQIEYLAGLDGDTSKAERKVLRDAKKRAQLITDRKFEKDAAAKDLMAYWPAAFWTSIQDYDPVKMVEQQDMNYLILQGEKDYQVTMVDFSIWQNALPAASHPKVQFKSYQGLTHLFTPTDKEMSGPSDYFKPQNVDETVIMDISIWVKSL